MAVYPGATYRPLNQFSNQGARPRLGVVLHVNDSEGPSLYNWIAGNNGMSCHFQVAKDGTVEQYVDTDNGSWCQVNGNDTWISIETEGLPTEALTAAQITACAGIVKWCHDTHGIPLVISDDVNTAGFGWHGMGGTSWGDHPGCPGDIRKAQRANILAAISAAPTDWFDMATVDDLKNALRSVLNEGTAAGQTSWAGTSKAQLSTEQALVNLVNTLPGRISTGAVSAADIAAAIPPDLAQQVVTEINKRLAS